MNNEFKEFNKSIKSIDSSLSKSTEAFIKFQKSMENNIFNVMGIPKEVLYDVYPKRSFINRILFNILCLGFKLINYNHFKEKVSNNQFYYKKIIKIKGFRTALVETFNGNRITCRFYWKIGKYLI